MQGATIRIFLESFKYKKTERFSLEISNLGTIYRDQTNLVL
jgi:hypothetical protein